MLNFLFTPHLAYIDPAATSILITSISGIVIAVGATATILWRKFKKKVSKVLHIDENANKETEEDIVINEPASEASEATAEVSENVTADN